VSTSVPRDFANFTGIDVTANADLLLFVSNEQQR
jgi:hypothetical protein